MGKLPFYFVQIAPFGYKELNAGYLREAQQQTMLTVPNTGMVVTLDVGEYASIHPRKKQQVGERLAAWALAETYHKKVVHARSILYKKAIFQNNGTVVVHCLSMLVQG
jgi:sialate O-acetylesterase